MIKNRSYFNYRMRKVQRLFNTLVLTGGVIEPVRVYRFSNVPTPRVTFSANVSILDYNDMLDILRVHDLYDCSFCIGRQLTIRIPL